MVGGKATEELPKLTGERRHGMPEEQWSEEPAMLAAPIVLWRGCFVNTLGHRLNAWKTWGEEITNHQPRPVPDVEDQDSRR